MAVKTNWERIEEARKKRAEEGESKTNSNVVSNSNWDRITKHRQEKSIDFDTLQSDLDSIGSTVFGIFDSWQTQETMKNTKSSVESLFGRLGAYEDYRKQTKDSNLPDLSELHGTYKSALDMWDDYAEMYGQYKTPEAYKAAQTKYRLDEQFKGLSYDDVQAKMKEYAPDSDEYNYLKNYTQYSSTEDFEKAISAMDFVDEWKSNSNAYKSQIKGLTNRQNTIRGRSRGMSTGGNVGNQITNVEKQYDDYAVSLGYSDRAQFEQDLSKHGDYRENLEEARNIYKLEDGAADGYKHLEQNEDFAKFSQYDPSVNKSEKILEMDDPLYNYINNIGNIREVTDATAIMNGTHSAWSDEGYDLLYDDEVGYYNYLKHLDRKNGTKEADKFLKDMKPALQKRKSDENAAYREELLKNPFAATAFSVVSPFMTLGGAMGNLLATGKDIITGSEYNAYDPLRELSNANTHGRQIVGQNIAEATEGFELFGQNIPSFLYQTGESVLDTIVGGGTVGKAYTLLMGTNAYQQKAKELTEAGEDKFTVQGLAIVSGALEAAFEYAGFEHLLKLKDADSIYKVLYNAFASQGGVEGLEELGTFVSTMMADIAFRGEDSDYIKKYNDLLERGYSTNEANTEVAKAIASEAAWSYMGGWVSGSALGGVQSATQYSGNVQTGKDIRKAEQIGNVFDMASISPEASEAYEAYTRYANKGINSENITDAQLGNLFNTVSAETTEGYRTAYKDMDKAKGIIDKQKAIREAETSSEVQKNRATAKLDKAISNYTDAQTRMGKYGETMSKVSAIGDSVVKSKVNEAYEKAEAKRKADHEAEVKKLSSGVETSVMADSDKDIEIKGIKDRDTLITSEGEVAIKDVELSDRDADLLVYARGMATEEANLFMQQYDGKADIEQYTNDFNRVVYYAQHSGFTEKYILEHAGSLSGEQVSAIYENTVLKSARLKEAENKKLMEATANGTTYRGYIDDTVISKIGWNNLNKRQKDSVEFLKVFATKTGMNLVFEPYSDNSNGHFNIRDNTIHVSLYAGVIYEKGKLRDTIIPTASHEITHWMEEKSPELYVKLKDTVLNALEETMGKSQADIIAEEIARLDSRHKDKKHTEKDAVNEIVARACEDMLAMSEEGKKMFDSMTDDEKKTFADKVKEIIENLKKWIDEFLSSYKSETVEARALQNYKEKLEEISKIWDEMLVHSIEVNQAMEKADVFSSLKDGISADGTTIVGKNNLQMSDKTYREGGRDFLVNWLEGQKDLSEEDKQNIIDQTDRVAEIMRAIDRGGELPEYSRWANLEVVKDENGEKVLSVIVKNGDYAMNIDFSQVCKKRVALNAVLNKMVQSGDLNVFTLSETDVADLNAIIKEHDFEIACALCFVDSKRYRVGAWADSFCEGSDEKKSGKWVHKYGFNEMVRSLIPKGSNIKVDEFNFTNRDIKNQPKKNLLSDAKDTDLDFTLIDSIMANNDSKNAQHRYAKAIKENPEIRKILNSAEIISSIGLDAIRLESPKLYGLINGHQGTAKPKFAHDIVAYGNDVLKASNFTPEKAKMVGGVRCQSFSDFMAVMVVDYAQFVSELAAKKLTAHSYTKEPLFVKLFGLTGMKINMSLVPKAIDMTPEQQKQFAILKDTNANKRSKEYKAALAEYEKLSENAGLDENGNYIWEDETFPYDIAMEIVVDKRYSKNCGTIAVGISNNHIKKLLADERISMVIPYHKSGLNHEVAMMRDIALYKDYTDYQNTRDKATGKKLDSKNGQTDFDFYGDLYGVDGKEGTHDPKQTAENYKRWCYENNYIPKFDDFMLDPNYYKLLIDFRVYDVDGTYAEQQPVQAIYPSNDEFKDLILNGVKDKNGKVYGGLKQQQSTTDRLDAESQQIIDEYRQRLREKYGEDVLVQFSDKDGDVKKAEELSETDLRYLLEKVQNGELEDSSYIPMRATTPDFFIDVVSEHSEGKIKVMHVPMAAQVEHVRQNMEEEEGLSYGEHRPHNFDVDDIVTISKEMGHPAYIVLQKNGRYAMVVSFYNSVKKKVVVSIDFASDKEPIKNYKYRQYVNGYNEGYYNIIVTQFEPDDLSSYLKNNEVVYDKQKMNGRYQVGSGRIVTFTHDTPFIDNTVSHPDSEINDKTVNNDDLQHSDKYFFSTQSMSESEVENAQEVIKNLKTRAIGSKYVDSYASYTAERIDREIKNSSSKDELDYAKSYITWVSPIDFVYATTTSEQYRNQLKEEAGTLDIEKLRNQEQPIHLTVNFETGEIVGHEGRHRMLALQEKGIERVAVIIDALNDNRHHTKPIDFMPLKGQTFAEHRKGTDMYLHDMLPLSQRYADTAREVFTNKPKSGVQFSDKDSDYMEAVNNGDMKTAQRMVDEAAKNAGAILDDNGVSLKLYRGTVGGQTIFAKDTTLNGKIYTIDNIDIATIYGDKSGRLTDIQYQTKGEKTTYALYGFPKNMLTIDAQYGVWSDLVIPKELLKYSDGRYKASNAEIAEWAELEGYDALRINNVRDGSFDTGSEVIFFDENLVKSADSITYDNNGNVIPLSERFNAKNDDIRYSDKDDTSVYDLMGEKEKLLKENNSLKADVERLKERLTLEGQVTHGKYFNDNQVLAAARHLRKISNSDFPVEQLAKMLKEVYSYIAHGENITWEEVFSRCYYTAKPIMNMAKPSVWKDDRYKKLLKEIKNSRISFDEKQIEEARYRYGNNWNRYFFGKVIVSNDGHPLDSKWQEWASLYPEFFDADTNSINQVSELLDIIDGIRRSSEIIEEYDVEENTRWLATEVYNTFWNVSPIRTTADKYEKKIKHLNFEHRQMMSEVREKHNKQLEEQKLTDQMYYGRKMSELRNDMNEKLSAQRKADRERFKQVYDRLRENKDIEVKLAKELGKERLSMYKENAERKTKIQSITSNALSLNELLLKNSKDKHVPEAMKGAVRELLVAIDFSSKRLLEGGEPTKKDISLEKALGHLKDAITDGSKEIGDILDEMYGSGIDDLTKELVKSVDEHMSLIDGQVFTLNEMSLYDLKKLDTIVKIMKQTVNRVNKFHTAQYNRGVQALGVRSTEEVDARKKVFKDNNKHFEKLKTHLYWNNLNPYYAFKDLGGAAQIIFTALQDGQDKLAFLSKEVIDFAESVYSTKDYDKWSDTYFDFEIPQPNGKIAKFSMNVSQIMSLYCVTKQEDARRHILHGDENGNGGGITIVETVKKEAVRNNIRLTEANLKSIIDKLDGVKNVKGDKTAKGVADELQEFMCRRGAELGNEISMARWGIKSFGITNYFPIKVSEGSAPIKNDTPGVNSTSMLELLNMSFTHARNHFAKQSVEIGDVFDVFANHMSNMIRYNAMALPILDMYKWMNCRGVDEYGTEYSVQTSIKNTFGDHAWSYFSTLLKDISGGTKKSTRDKLAVRFFKNAKIAKVAANIRVVALQFTSYIRAGAVMDNKYLLKAIMHKPKSAKAKERCGIALWKSMGYYDTDITRGLTEQIKHTSGVKDKIVEWSLKGAEKADEFTWGYLWNACELEIRDTRKDLEVGSEEFFTEIGKRLREVIYRTQVVDSMLTRSQMMRSPDGWDKVLTTFASENTLSLNMAMDVFTSYELDKRSVGKKAAKEKNKKYMRKAITAYIVTNVVTSALQSMFDAYRDYDEDEKDEEYWAKLMLTNFLSNTSIINKIPYLNTFGSILQGFTPSRADTDWMNDSVKAVRAIYKCFTEGGETEKAMRYTLKTLSDSTGIAAYNVYRDIYALYKLFADE